MTTRMTWSILAAGVALLVIAGAVAGVLSKPSETANGTATIALVTATAVGIERVLELFWVAAGQLASAWWPLDVPVRRLDEFATDLQGRVRPVVDSAERLIGTAERDAGAVPDRLKAARGRLDELKGYLDEVEVDAPPTQARAAAMIAAVNGLVDWDPQLAAGAGVAKRAIADLSTFASSFDDNPARRLISLFAGALLGLGIAAFTQVDLFRASGIAHTQLGPYQWGIVATGMVMGLGSNPTHEVINAIKAFKETHKRAAGIAS